MRPFWMSDADIYKVAGDANLSYRLATHCLNLIHDEDLEFRIRLSVSNVTGIKSATGRVFEPALKHVRSRIAALLCLDVCGCHGSEGDHLLLGTGKENV